jgi:hypothetical protein
MSPEVSDHSVQEAWDEEVVRRMEDFKAEKSATVPWGASPSRTSGNG